MTDCEICEGLREEIKELNLQLINENRNRGFYDGRSAALTAQVEAQNKQIIELLNIIKG
jgi:hypothetical protein